MGTGRLEAFSDGVIAIIITIMVLELKAPEGHGIAALVPLAPVFLSYVLSFVYVGIYWNNHHHMLHACEEVSGGILWANLHLLFWLSLIPFATAWLGENHFSSGPAALYGAILLLSAIAYVILQQQIIKSQRGKRDILGQAIGNDSKGKVSVSMYLAGIGAAFWQPRISLALYGLTALIWFIPDRRIEKVMKSEIGN
jgi:TMEM175 potassium channel family protein